MLGVEREPLPRRGRFEGRDGVEFPSSTSSSSIVVVLNLSYKLMMKDGWIDHDG